MRNAIISALHLAVLFVPLLWFGAGCCGVLECPTQRMVQTWVSREIPPGTTPVAAADAMRRHGFDVHVEARAGDDPLYVEGTRSVGTCLFPLFNEYYIRITALLNGHPRGVVESVTVERRRYLVM